MGNIYFDLNAKGFGKKKKKKKNPLGMNQEPPLKKENYGISSK